jgi:hypothetical protein
MTKGPLAKHIFFYYYYWWGGTKSLRTAATSGLLYKPQMIDEDDCGAIGGNIPGYTDFSSVSLRNCVCRM